MSLLFANNAAGTLSAGITAAATSLTLNAGQAAAFPAPTAPDTFYATLTDQATQSLIEVVSVSNVSGSTFTIARGQDGTTAQSWNAGDIVSHRANAAVLRLLNSVVPSGGILMWSGSVASIPEGWHLCDGTNGTPNLQNQFVVGAGATYAPGATGGATSVTLSVAQLPAHNHGINDPGHVHTVTDPGHTHTDAGHVHQQNSATIYQTTGNFVSSGSLIQISTGVLNTATSFAQLSTVTTGISLVATTTGITTQNAGSGNSVPTLPPYYALCYIMKL